MKIIVVSDTHMPRMNKKLPDRLLRELPNTNAIIHAGDWTSLSVYDQLSAFAPTYGVAGNNDSEEMIRKFGLRKLLEFDGCRIGVVHGHSGSGKRSNTESNAMDAFKGVPLQAIVYGHSHIPVLKRVRGMLIFNPGSPTDKRRQPLYSFGIFHISTGKLTAEHVLYADKT